ncbi:MAG: 4Fe-4S dicluster domain-containing protein [Nitrospirae bacterium]|nr:MAG: 4Fe-4S dicluster domain-containing protein [Nitrospirota bacterium]
MKRPVVDYETCIGCGSCVEICPAVFELRSCTGKKPERSGLLTE